MISDLNISLLPMTTEMYHAYFMEYENDPDLCPDKSTYTPYTYNKEKVDRYIQKQIDLNRKTFAILCNGETVGELILKNIIPEQCATLSLSMKNAKFKDRGFGTLAEKLAIDYVFRDLNIPTLYADALRTNTRSQHVMEKVGFRLIKEDGDFKYYRIDRPTEDPNQYYNTISSQEKSRN